MGGKTNNTLQTSQCDSVGCHGNILPKKVVSTITCLTLTRQESESILDTQGGQFPSQDKEQ